MVNRALTIHGVETIGSYGRAAPPAAPPATLTCGRLARRRGRDGPDPGAVVPLLPAQRAVCRTRMPVEVERDRGVLRGAQRHQVGQWVIERLASGPGTDVGVIWPRGHRARPQ
jgi:hypothetical protein